jgi:hypothetical protein
MAKPARRKPISTAAKGERVVDLLDVPLPTRAERARANTPAVRMKVAIQTAHLIRACQNLWPWEPEPLPWRPEPLHLEDLSFLGGKTRPQERLKPQQELCLRAFRKLYPDGRIPDEVELSTKALRAEVEVELEREAKKAGKRAPPTPHWNVVRAARSKFSQSS